MGKRRRQTTEEWLHRAWDLLKPLVEGAVGEAPDWVVERCEEPVSVQLGVGYHHDDRRRVTYGWADSADNCKDGTTYTIVLSPELLGDKRLQTVALAVLLHECLHVWTEAEDADHGRAFQHLARKCGLRKPYYIVNGASISPRLRRILQAISTELGPCPWKPLRSA